MNLIGRDEDDNRIHLENREVDPYFCVPSEQVDTDLLNHHLVDRVEDGYTSIRGRELSRVYTYMPGDVPQVRDRFEHYEADILFPNRFSLDTGIYRGVEIDDVAGQEVPLEDIDKIEYSTETRMLFCDIEVDDEGGFPDEQEAIKPIVCISFYDSFTGEYHVYLFEKKGREPAIETQYVDDVNLEIFDDEVKMLEAFAEYLDEHWPDVLTGWNFKEFDAVYLINRCETLDGIESDTLSPLGTAYDDTFYGRTIGKIKGIAVFDMLDGYKNLEFSELDSFSLDDVAQEELDIGKLEKEGQSINTMYHDDLSTLLEYNIRDVYLTVALEEERDIVAFYEEVCNFVGGRLGEVVDYSKAADIYVLRTCNGRFVLPSSRTVEGGDEEFEGAEVFDPATEVKEMISVLDLKSLYPMSMETLNAGPRTKDPDGEITAPNGVSYTTEKDSIVKQMIDDLLDERDLLKEKRNSQSAGSRQYHKFDMQQRAVKVIMNCFSGDTDVVTPDGIRNIKDIEVGDEVYTINPDTHDVEIRDVIDTTRQENLHRELEHIQTQHTDLMITPSHRMFVNSDSHTGSFMEHYDDLSRGYDYNIPLHNKFDGRAETVVDIVNFVDEAMLWITPTAHGSTFKANLPSELENALSYYDRRNQYLLTDLDLYWKYGEELYEKADIIQIQPDKNKGSIYLRYDLYDWLKLTGWIIARGSFYHGEKSTGGEYKRINMTRTDDYETSKIKTLLDRLGIQYGTSDDDIIISNRLVYDIFVDQTIAEPKDTEMPSYLGSKNRKIPEYIFDNQIDGTILMHLLDVLIRANGRQHGNDSYAYSTTSDQMKEDLVKLSVKCGFKPSVSQDDDFWTIYLNRNSGSFRKEEVETKDHDGQVYCITVRGNYTVLAGRNGKFQWTGNTLYGLLGWDRFRLYDQDNAAAVTATGREVIKFTQEKVSDMGYEVIYGDTDSVMVEFTDTNTATEVIELSFEMEKVINEAYDEFARERLNTDEHWFEMEFEKLYRIFIQAGKKKRYAGHIIWKEGKHVDDIDIVGFEFQRSDYSDVARNLQMDLIEAILMGAEKQEVSDLVRDRIEKIKNLAFEYDELGIAGGIGRAFDQYDSKTKHVRGAEYANEHLGEQIQPGDKPKGIYVERVGGEYPPAPTLKDSKFIVWMNQNNVPDTVTIDFDKYLDIQIDGPLSRIIECTEWLWEEIRTGQDQASIGSFDSNTEETIADDDDFISNGTENEDAVDTIDWERDVPPEEDEEEPEVIDTFTDQDNRDSVFDEFDLDVENDEEDITDNDDNKEIETVDLSEINNNKTIGEEDDDDDEPDQPSLADW